MLKETAVVNNTIIMVIPAVQTGLYTKFGKTTLALDYIHSSVHYEGWLK
jgi:hypothetical protein